jgi:hypothetical protein
VNLYVWEGKGVLEGTYGTGLIVAVAPDLESAKTASRQAYGTEVGRDDLERSLALPPEVVDLATLAGARAWMVAGD